jgi:hypothetical protein
MKWHECPWFRDNKLNVEKGIVELASLCWINNHLACLQESCPLVVLSEEQGAYRRDVAGLITKIENLTKRIKGLENKKYQGMIICGSCKHIHGVDEPCYSYKHLSKEKPDGT